MGSAISAVRATVEQPNNDEQRMTREALDFMDKMLDTKMSSFSQSLKHPPDDSHEIPIGNSVYTRFTKTINVQKQVNENIEKAIDKAIDTSFNGDVIDGFKVILRGALNTFLGETTGGETYTRHYHIVFENNALVRVDILFYHYGFATKGAVHGIQNAFCYMVNKSVVQMDKVPDEVILYSITDYVQKGLKKAGKSTSESNKYLLQYIQEYKEISKALSKK